MIFPRNFPLQIFKKSPWGDENTTLVVRVDYERAADSIEPLLKAVSETKIRLTIACVGKRYENESEYRRYVDKAKQQGHEIISHTYSHRVFAKPVLRPLYTSIAKAEQRKEIRRSIEVLPGEISGLQVRGGKNAKATFKIANEEGINYICSGLSGNWWSRYWENPYPIKERVWILGGEISDWESRNLDSIIKKYKRRRNKNWFSQLVFHTYNLEKIGLDNLTNFLEGKEDRIKTGEEVIEELEDESG